VTVFRHLLPGGALIDASQSAPKSTGDTAEATPLGFDLEIPLVA